MLFIFVSIAGLRRLQKPLLDLNITKINSKLATVFYVAALPGGGAVVYYVSNNKTDKVIKMDSQGTVTQVIYSCVLCRSSIFGLLVLGKHLYLTHGNGTVLKTPVSDGRILRRSTIPNVISVTHQGSLYSEPNKIPDKQTLLLCDYIKGEVFTFKPSTGQKKVRVTGLRYPRSVSYFIYNQTVFYIVCEEMRHRINVYDHTWNLLRTMGSRGSFDGELSQPSAAIVSDEGTIIITDRLNYRVSEFTFNGTFIHHLLASSDGVKTPHSMSYSYPHLWVVNSGNLYRYNLYR